MIPKCYDIVQVLIKGSINIGKQENKKAQKRMMMQEYLRSMDGAADKNIEFPFISFEDIILATDNFSDSNILGRGGFGKVYKVMMVSYFTLIIALKRVL